jgi:hypothetical protein
MTGMPFYRLKSALLVLTAAAAVVLGGCAASSSDREDYFASRNTLVSAQPGNGTSRVALWPAGAIGKSSVAMADRQRPSDAPPVPAR